MIGEGRGGQEKRRRKGKEVDERGREGEGKGKEQGEEEGGRGKTGRRRGWVRVRTGTSFFPLRALVSRISHECVY